MTARVGTRGLTFGKLERVRQVLHQLCSDEENPRSLTAVLMAERDVTARDVETVCEVARDALEAFRGMELDAMDERELPVPVPFPSPAQSDGSELRQRNRERALAMLPKLSDMGGAPC